MDSLISTFHIDWKLMVAQLINFVVVIIVLWLFALKPLKKLMDERGATIKGGLDNADLQKKLLAEFQEKVKNEQIELDRALMQQQKDFKKDLQTLRAKSSQETVEMNQKMVEDAKKAMEMEKNRIMAEAQKEIGKLLLMIAEKTFGDNIDEKTKLKLVEEGIKDIK